jgi:sialic acid synthase SpsE
MRTKIIAEVSSNHGGDIGLAKEFIRVAASLGLDYVKFQSWQVGTLRDGPADPQFGWLSKAELSDAAHRELLEECQKQGIAFLTTVFHPARVSFLKSLGLAEIKVGSGEALNGSLLRAVKGGFQNVMISTGLALDHEVLEIVEIMKGSPVTLFHCVSLYPLPVSKVNMVRMDWLKKLCPRVGYSDHTVGLEAAKMAIDRGASLVEKHFCLGRSGPGRVNDWDATPDEMAGLREYAERGEKMMGDGGVALDAELSEARRLYLGRFAKED